jgi:adenylate cyclase
MMSDLRGFTAMSERMNPQDLITMLNHYFGVMYEEIERYNGTLIEFMGDGMLVIFGAPVTTRTHASDAVAAALGMQKRMREVNKWNAERGYEPLEMGIGINTDEMILGNIEQKMYDLTYIVGTVYDHILDINGEKIVLNELCGKNAKVCFSIK